LKNTLVIDAAYEVGAEDGFNVGGVGLHAAILGGIKGLLHGVLDYFVIKSLISAIGGIGGPVGAVVAPVIIGGLYNLAKDSIRKKLNSSGI
jgi:hypothetical protein